MISQMRLIILFYLIVSLIDFVNGYNCFEIPASDDCSCSDQTGANGTCICSGSVRHNLPCAKFNGVDSVSFRRF
jgi:hypothetical protein